MIPDSWFAPLTILAGAILIAITLFKAVKGKRETAFIIFGKLIFAIFVIVFGVLLYKAGVAPK